MSSHDLLSQDEIDALLHGIDLGQVEQDMARASRAGDVTLYDFFSQDRVVQGRMPGLDVINGRFARSLQTGISGSFSRNVQVSVQGVQMLKFSEFVQNLQTAASLNLAAMKPLPGTALCVLDPALVFRATEYFFGGDGRSPVCIEATEFTPMEQWLIECLRQQVLGDWQQAWSSVVEIKPEWFPAEAGVSIEGLFDATETMVVTSFNLDFQGVGGDLQMVLPYAMLEPVLDRLGNNASNIHGQEDYGWRAAMHHSIQDAKVSVSSTLVEVSVDLRTLASLREGDVIPFELPELVLLSAGPKPLFRAELGMQKGHYAVRIDESCNCEQTDLVESPGENHE